MSRVAVEVRKSFPHGFLLSEQELSRISSCVRELLSKATDEANIQILYLIKYQNGVIAQENELTPIFAQENEGSEKVINLSIVGTSKERRPNHLVKLSFYNMELDDTERNPIRLEVRGTEKDWVFVCVSTLEERLDKIRRRGFKVPKTLSGVLAFFGYVIMMLIFLMSMTTSFKADYVDQAERQWKGGTLRDPIEALILIKRGEIQNLNLLPALLKSMLIPAGIILVIFLVYQLYKKWFPLYNFNWGDYLQTFEKVERQRKTFLTVIIIGLVVSIAGSIIANLLGAIKIF